MRKSLLITFFSACFLASHADEGMWMLTDLKKQNAAVMQDLGLDISIDKVDWTSALIRCIVLRASA